jgi:signal transduction histidine kinase
MALIHIPTVYLFLSFIYLLMPIAIWIALNNRKSKPMIWWCIGGELFAIGLLLVGLRPALPTWVSYALANGLSWLAVCMQATALLLALRQRPPLPIMVAAVLVWIAVFEYFRQGLENSHLRFGWALIFYALAFAYIAQLSARISVEHGLKNARTLAVIYGVGALIVCIRILRIVFGYTEPDAAAQGVDSFLLVISGVMVSVLGSFAFVGLFVERAVKREVLATEERVRQEESARLGEQIAQLERQRTLGAMSYSFAHELSQPLTAILMDTHAIKSSLSANQLNVSEIKESIEDVERSAKRTVQLVERIRSFVRPTQGDYEDVDMKVLVHDVQHLLAHDIRAQNVQFEWDFDDSACLVHGDKIQLSQIVLNVYRNAIQAMVGADLRKISVSLEREDQRVVLRVHDSGAGLDDAVKDQVGQPFVTTKREGLGVGLSISKTIAEMHNGSLTITNAVGGGALVELNLPAVNA